MNKILNGPSINFEPGEFDKILFLYTVMVPMVMI